MQFGKRSHANAKREIGRLTARRAALDPATPAGKTLCFVIDQRIAALSAEIESGVERTSANEWAGGGGVKGKGFVMRAATVAIILGATLAIVAGTGDVRQKPAAHTALVRPS